MSTEVKILIVDDEADICFFLSHNLKKRGFSTSCSFTLEKAKQQISSLNPNILILDNQLPDGSGIDFISHVHEKHPDTKVVMITAHDSPKDKSKAFNNGVALFLSKPFTISEINQAVDKVMTEK